MRGSHMDHPGAGDAPATAALAERLLRASTPEEVASILLDADPALHAPEAHVLWSTDWPRQIVSAPPGCPDAVTAAALHAVSGGRAGITPQPSTRVLLDDGATEVAVLHCRSGCERLSAGVVDAVAARFAETLSMQRLREAVARLEQSEKLQRSLYAIADMAGSDLDMPDLLRGLHRIVSDLMYAENFYIALYDPVRDSLRFPYFVDTVDTLGPALADEIPLSQLERGLTWYLVRDGKPLMGTTEDLRQQVSGPLELVGADSVDWLGVPMMREGRVIGALVVQSYLEGVRYSRADMGLLAFVAEHVLTALERKTSQEEMERRVVERTRELAEANAVLSREVAERERGEQLQAALYRIAALASTDETSERFYRHVHSIVGELLNANNFYIALLSDDGEEVSFPYAVDEQKQDWMARPFGRGLTEYVIRTGQPQLVDGPRAGQLAAQGEIARRFLDGTTHVWLGAPLFDTDRVIGAVVVQTYSEDESYDERDLELLRFVSYQIASSLQRRRSAERLLQANAELEQRVEERTRELRGEIQVREQVEALLKHQVLHDPLTSLPNRVYLRDRIERALAVVRRDRDYRFGLLYIDVDRFKLVNDSLGHLAGDQILQEVANRLAGSVREPDVVARLSGDEFAILLEHVQIPETATRIARRVLRAMERPIEVSGQQIQVGASIGMAIGDHRYGSVDAVLRDADTALYRAKSTGRNRLVLFDEQLDQAAVDGLALEQDLRRALANDEFLPYFQPLVRLEDEATVGYEALLRWRHPQRGILVPGDFLRTAEDSGLIETIDWRLFGAAMAQAVSFIGDDMFLTINVSPRLFRNAEFDEHLLALANGSGYSPCKLRIEVTEGTLLEDPSAVVAILERLREAKIHAALDDFGTGYSSLGHVHLFPLRMIKIDRSFVSEIGQGASSRSAAVIEAILALARSLGLEVVAEGIETEHQRDALRALGCTYGQGYLFARPQPASHWAAVPGG
jgi:diguanylate cyclase (GGDEF)-like protein